MGGGASVMRERASVFFSFSPIAAAVATPQSTLDIQQPTTPKAQKSTSSGPGSSSRRPARPLRDRPSRRCGPPTRDFAVFLRFS